MVRAASVLARRANSHAANGTQTVHAVAAQNRTHTACNQPHHQRGRRDAARCSGH
jgi:hypothetical protein